MRISQQGTVVHSRIDQGEGSCCMAHVCVTQSGRWLVGFSAASQKITLQPRSLVTWSDDGGATWSQPFDPFPDVPKLDGRAGGFRKVGFTALPDGRVVALMYWLDQSDLSLAFFDDDTESLVDSQLFMSISEDDGATWATPWHVDPACYRDMARPSTGPMLIMPDGRWACQFELNKRYNMPGEWVHKPVLAFSDDEGRTWPDCVLPASDETNRLFHWDQRPSVFAGDGKMLNVYWMFDREASKYVNMHASESTDGGRTWSDTWDIGVPGQPAPPQRLSNGDIVLVYVDRTAEPTITARLSRDGGRTFDADSTLAIHRRSDVGRQETPENKQKMGDAWDEMYEYSVGLPDTHMLPGDRVLVTWYTGPNAKQTDIAFAVLDAS